MKKLILVLVLITASFIGKSQGTAENLKIGQFLRFNDEIMEVTEIVKRSPTNPRPFYQAKMTNLKNNQKVEYRLRAGESVEIIEILKKEMVFVSSEGESAIFMDPETFEQTYISKNIFPDNCAILMADFKVTILFEKGGSAITSTYPPFYIMTVKQTASTDTQYTKNEKTATLDNGVVINVPLFIKTGDKIKVEPNSHSYIGKVQ